MKNKISYKLISLILLISIIVTSISIYIQIQNQRQNNISKFENNLNNIKKTQIPILSQALWNVDHLTIDIIVDNLLNNEKIIYAQVIENNKSIKEAGTIKKLNVIKKEFAIIKTEDSQTYDIGKLIVIADLEPMYKEIKDNAINIILTEIIKMFLISFLIIFILKRLLTNHLEQLSDYAYNLSLENLSEPFKIDKPNKSIPNELDILSNSINTMRLNLIHQIKQSEEKNNMLSQQSKMAAMGEMIGNIAHQWKQPLSVITALTSGLKLSYDFNNISKEKFDDYTDKVIHSANYLSDTINDFKNFFKPDKEKKTFSLINTFEKTFTLLNTQFTNNNITVDSNIKEFKIYGFENELIQVLINILNNAKDALRETEKQKLLIQINTFSKEDNIHICIRDNAGGIEDTLKEKIFEPYFTTKDESLGTGIGLYMSSEIIEKHMKGKLCVQNVNFKYEEIDYRGAEFSIVIPNS